MLGWNTFQDGLEEIGLGTEDVGAPPIVYVTPLPPGGAAAAPAMGFNPASPTPARPAPVAAIPLGQAPPPGYLQQAGASGVSVRAMTPAESAAADARQQAAIAQQRQRQGGGFNLLDMLNPLKPLEMIGGLLGGGQGGQGGGLLGGLPGLGGVGNLLGGVRGGAGGGPSGILQGVGQALGLGPATTPAGSLLGAGLGGVLPGTGPLPGPLGQVAHSLFGQPALPPANVAAARATDPTLYPQLAAHTEKAGRAIVRRILGATAPQLSALRALLAERRNQLQATAEHRQLAAADAFQREVLGHLSALSTTAARGGTNAYGGARY